VSTATKHYSTRALREVDNLALYRQKLERFVRPQRRLRIVRWVLGVAVVWFMAQVVYQLVRNPSVLGPVRDCLRLDCLLDISL
jgi:hypothetical protein